MCSPLLARLRSESPISLDILRRYATASAYLRQEAYDSAPDYAQLGSFPASRIFVRFAGPPSASFAVLRSA